MKTISIPFPVPDWVEWVAQDEDGEWWAHEMEPYLWRNVWDNDKDTVFIEKGSPNPNWRETLRKV